jgi:hypothetical protein
VELVSLDPLAERDVAHDDLGHRDDAERLERWHRELEHDAAPLLRVRVAELRLEPAGDRHDRVLVQHAEHLHVGGGADLDREVLREERRQALELLREDAGASSGVPAKNALPAATSAIEVRSSSSKPSPKPIVVVPTPSSHAPRAIATSWSGSVSLRVVAGRQDESSDDPTGRQDDPSF